MKLIIDEINRIFERFLEDKRFSVVRDEIENMGSFLYYLINRDGVIVYRQEQDTDFCRIIKAQKVALQRCNSLWLSVFQKIKEYRKLILMKCHAQCLAWGLPLFAKDELIGVFFGCQIPDPTVDYNKIQINTIDFYTYKENIIKADSIYSYYVINNRINLINSVCQILIDLILSEEALYYKQVELDKLERFYNLLTEIPLLKSENLYQQIVELISKAMNVEISSLVLLCGDRDELVIKAARGLPEDIIGRVKLKVGEGIVGYVAKTKEPLLVKDITNDKRFNIVHKPHRYYTKSLLSVPLLWNDRFLGVLNVNNELTKRHFTEADLNVLTKMSHKISEILVKFGRNLRYI